MLVGERSIAINRAAMAAPELAEVLLAEGRFAAGPIVEKYLARLDDIGVLRIADPVAAFRMLYGLVVQDTQIRVLLGDRRPTHEELRAQAAAAVETFVGLHAMTVPEPHGHVGRARSRPIIAARPAAASAPVARSR